MYLVFGKSKNKPPHLSIRSMPFRQSSQSAPSVSLPATRPHGPHHRSFGVIGALNQAPHRDRRDAFLGARPLQLSRPSCNLLSAICLLNILERVSSWVGFELFRAFSELRAAQLAKQRCNLSICESAQLHSAIVASLRKRRRSCTGCASRCTAHITLRSNIYELNFRSKRE